jgi:hypothetical protein
MDNTYYRERERTELRMAAEARCMEAQLIHRELASRYHTLVEREAAQEHPRLDAAT